MQRNSPPGYTADLVTYGIKGRERRGEEKASDPAAH